MILLDIQQNTPEWEELRRTKIGASDCPIILGHSPYKTAYELWIEKQGGDSKIFKSTSMQRGHALEPIARKWYCDRHMVNIEPAVVQSETYDWMIASLDGLGIDHILEIKCPSEKTIELVKRGDVPLHWSWQIMHQMAVTGFNKAVLVVFDGYNGIEIEIYREEESIQHLIAEEKKFYDGLINFVPPDEDLMILEDDETKELMKRMEETKKNLKFFEDAYEELKKQAIALNNGLSYQCEGTKVQKIIAKGNVNYKKLVEDYQINVNPYRAATREYWRVS